MRLSLIYKKVTFCLAYFSVPMRPVSCLFYALSFLLAGPLIAQPNLQNNDAQQRAMFRQGFLKGCLAGKSTGNQNQPRFCNCLADAYNTRYSGNNLVVISSLAAQLGSRGPLMVDVMMTPERQVCTTSN